MQRYVEARREVVAEEGLDPDALIGNAVETPVLTSVATQLRLTRDAIGIISAHMI